MILTVADALAIAYDGNDHTDREQAMLMVITHLCLKLECLQESVSNTPALKAAVDKIIANRQSR
jgi:hypothetical protein